MGLQLERKYSGADYVQIFGPLCGIEKITHSQRRVISIPEYVSNGKLSFSCRYLIYFTAFFTIISILGQRWIFGKRYSRLFENG